MDGRWCLTIVLDRNRFCWMRRNIYAKANRKFLQKNGTGRLPQLIVDALQLLHQARVSYKVIRMREKLIVITGGFLLIVSYHCTIRNENEISFKMHFDLWCKTFSMFWHTVAYSLHCTIKKNMYCCRRKTHHLEWMRREGCDCVYVDTNYSWKHQSW